MRVALRLPNLTVPDSRVGRIQAPTGARARVFVQHFTVGCALLHVFTVGATRGRTQYAIACRRLPFRAMGL